MCCHGKCKRTGVETWRVSDMLTDVFNQTLLITDNVLGRKQFFCKCTFFHWARLDVSAQTFSGMAVSFVSLKIWFWIYFSLPQLETYHWFISITSRFSNYLLFNTSSSSCLHIHSFSFLCDSAAASQKVQQHLICSSLLQLRSFTYLYDWNYAPMFFCKVCPFNYCLRQ